jgi:formyl-CoA transferase
MAPTRPLAGLTVLSLEQAMTLPFLTYRLACDGARVVRIENPRRPDPNRFVGKDVLGERDMCSYFLPNNCGKEAITLDLAQPEAHALLDGLIQRLRVDVFACNQRPRSYARLGIAPERLRALRPELIWLGISGFGPDHDEAAYDPVLQARSGFMELTGDPDGPPTIFGLPMVDLGAAEHAYGELMKALYHRARSGEGARLDVSMHRSALSWMVSPILHEALGEPVTRKGNSHQFFSPVGAYRARDGWIYLAVGSDAQWAALTALPAFASLARVAWGANAGRIADARAVDAALGAALAGLGTVDALAALHGAGVPASRVNALADVLADPLAAGRLLRVKDPRTGFEITLPPPPTGEPPVLAFPPRLGEHNARVYGEIGYAGAALEGLRARRVI